MKDKIDPETKKQTVKDILRALHNGLDPATAAERLLKEAGYLTTVEIAGIEQELMNEGIPPEEIQKFCNVHALIFEKTIQADKDAAPETQAVALFKAENDRIRALVADFRKLLAAGDPASLGRALDSFGIVIDHYVKKENALFPQLEQRGFTGPSKVMWGKHDEVRRLLKETRAAFARLPGAGSPEEIKKSLVEPLLAEIQGMIEKEELILYPTALEKLEAEDWERVRSSFIELERVGVERERAPLAGLEPASVAVATDGEVTLPSGRLSVTELTRILNLLPVDISFVDASDRVKYFSEPEARIFPRARSVIGREVRNCHPPKSLATVERILTSFKEGQKDTADFWINMGGKMILIRYLAVRDESGKYLGTLEVSQDITGIKALQGEKRLLDVV